MNRTRKTRPGFAGIIFLSLLLIFSVLSLNTVRAGEYPLIRTKGKLTTSTSYKITLKKYKNVTHWKIRMASVDEDGFQGDYETVRKLKVSKKTYTRENLQPDTNYYFEITGCVKKNGKLKSVIYDYLYCYTGMSNVGWDDYAASDAPCSPESITLWYGCYNDGLPVSGYELYRRNEDSEQWDMLTTLGTDGYSYDDKTVEAGKSYYYRLRAYGTYNGETLYSPYSEELLLSAVNQSGTFSSTLISHTKSTLVIKMDSEQYNGVLTLNSRYDLGIGEDISQFDDYEDIPLRIAAMSSDGETWTKLTNSDSVTLNGGESVYLRLKPLKKGTDISKGTVIGGYCVYYNGLPCSFYMTIGSTGDTWPNAEMIH